MKLRRIIFLVIAALVPLSAVAGSQSVLSPAGPAARRISNLGWVVFITFGIVTVVTISLVLYAACRRTGSLETHESWRAGGGQAWVLIGGLIIPVAILTAVFIMSFKDTAAFPLRSGGRKISPEILVIGHQWWWEVHYYGHPKSRDFTTANEIHIPVGRTITIALQSADVIHSFWVPALHGKVQLIPGITNYLRVEATRPGDFKGQCAVYCGEEHALMRLLVVAQSPKKYQAWYDNELKPGVMPQTPEAQEGEKVFDQSACALCHTIRGTGADGKLGPDLTHLASRKYIGADSFPNDKSYLEAWVTHAQSLKPGAEMPDLTMYTGTQLRDLLAYLRQLR